ncbi:hypothetical protein [Kineothrix sp. MB12-C1]|uniref:hypothetical protein n=1 Tax=Kineothrix sp. MB12-C1 TaxID=3070215 RepID=UPI0027D25866|nr:hypothetical protein [Kineothrix sp. MB12-C1]WMC91072.1 hypothetical protein RBB56_09210 [Kineothrix sp. MB12-C1]
MKTNGKIHMVTIIKIIISILSVSFGILSLILLRAQGYDYPVYVTILMCCISIASLLLLSSGILGILRHKKIEQEKLESIVKWVYAISGGSALLIIAPLTIILLSAQGISFTVFLPCFFVTLIVPVILIVVGIVKCINVCRS